MKQIDKSLQNSDLRRLRRYCRKCVKLAGGHAEKVGLEAKPRIKFGIENEYGEEVSIFKHIRSMRKIHRRHGSCRCAKMVYRGIWEKEQH